MHNGGTGADTMAGGMGDDTYLVDNAGDVVVENADEGIDTVQSSVHIALGANIENLVLTGTAAINGIGNELNNMLIGNSADNVLDGGTGADIMTGGMGDDTYLVDNAGDMVVENANEGIDTVQSSVNIALGANVENLVLTGSAAINGTGNELNNLLTGNSADNVLDGAAGDDVLQAGEGNDIVEGGQGNDTLEGGTGNDTYVFNLGNGLETITDTVGDDAIRFGQGITNQNISASVDDLGVHIRVMDAQGNDTGEGIDMNTLPDGTPAVETILFADGTTVKVTDLLNVYGTECMDVIVTGDKRDTIYAKGGPDIVFAGGNNDTVYGGDGNDALNGESGNDTLYGENDADLLYGGEGDDILDGGAGADVLIGGIGNDTYVVDNADDLVIEVANEGVDSVNSTINYTLSANVESLALTGTAAINGTGNTLNNILIGNNAANTLNGGTGADSMTGGMGDDTYLVDDTGDVVTENANEGTDEVQSSIAYTLGANVENLTLIGSSAINGTGNTLDNILTGNSGANTLASGAGNDTLNGGAGADSMIGGTGNDTYMVDNSGDVVFENANEGVDTINSAINYTLGANVENLILTGSGNIDGTGNTLNNILIGNSGKNTLTAGVGNDTLTGGAGNDALNGGTGNDTYLFGSGFGNDTIIDSDSTAGNTDTVQFAVNPLELIYRRSGNNLNILVNNTSDQVTVQNWYSSAANQTEVFKTGDNNSLLNTQVDQLIQAMASFCSNTGMTWSQAIQQKPQEVQQVLAQYWTPQA